ncbi:MAG: prepilin-type N-terminal cleavage/methylation domain-containing protein [Planctomycetota bacterium]
MRRNAGFTLIEMTVAAGLFAAGAIYIYGTFAGVTRSSRTATVQIDLGSQNKRALTRFFGELQASSLTPQDTDGLDATEPEAVLTIQDDDAAPVPNTKAIIVNRSAVGTVTQTGGTWDLGAGKMQARERSILKSKIIRFRKVVGYQFNAGAGTIVPEWSNWITYRVNGQNQLIRQVDGGATRVIANRVDALDVDPRIDGTVLVTLITARRNPTGAGWKRYANSITIHPKN